MLVDSLCPRANLNGVFVSCPDKECVYQAWAHFFGHFMCSNSTRPDHVNDVGCVGNFLIVLGTGSYDSQL